MKKTEKGNGETLKKICTEIRFKCHERIFVHTKRNKENLTTWQNKDEGHKKQLDYILISQKQQNWVMQIKPKGTANIDGQHQHKLLLMKIRVRLKKENDETKGFKHINYDIETMRGDPGKLIIKKEVTTNDEDIIKQ